MKKIVWQGTITLGEDGEVMDGGFVTYDRGGCVRGGVLFGKDGWGWEAGCGRVLSPSFIEALADANDELSGVTKDYDVAWEGLTGQLGINHDMWYGRINGFLIGTIEKVDGVYSWEMHAFNGGKRSGKTRAVDSAKRRVVSEFAKRMRALERKKGE